MKDYLTPEDYEIAEKNGISRKLADSRFYDNNWEKERAITQPKRGPVLTIWDEWKEIAETNGIGKSTFNSRLEYGWEPEVAATKELAKTRSGGSKHFSDEILKLAAVNGITPRRLYSRVFESNWSIEEAATMPLQKNNEIYKFRKRG